MAETQGHQLDQAVWRDCLHKYFVPTVEYKAILLQREPFFAALLLGIRNIQILAVVIPNIEAVNLKSYFHNQL